MTFFKKLTYQFVAFIFTLLLVSVPTTFALTSIISNQELIKTAFSRSGIYNQFNESGMAAFADKIEDPNQAALLKEPEFQKAVSSAFPPASLQEGTEQVIGGVYDWLNGKTAQPEFTIDLTEEISALRSNLTEYATNKAKSLPPCSIEDLQRLSANMDLSQITCLPPGVSAEQAGSQFANQFIASSSLLQDTVITGEEAFKNNPVDKNVPSAYQSVVDQRWFLLGILILLGLSLILLRKNRQAGMRYVGWSLIGSAVFLAIGLIVYWSVANSGVANSDDQIGSLVFEGMLVLLTAFNKIVAIFAATYAVIGIPLVVFARRMNKPEVLANPQPETPDTVETPSTETLQKTETPPTTPTV